MPPTEQTARLGPPDRWLACPRKSKLIENKFFAIKTPLCGLYDEYVPVENRFTPMMFLNSVESVYGKVGLWFDLTNTDRFYDPVELTRNQIEYVKLNCKGHGESPSIEVTEEFIRRCARFIKEKPRETIVVHCTHGFNRTGFLICAYMIQARDADPHAAVHTFAQARPPGIYKQGYLHDLFARYDGDENEAPPAPALPDWSYGGLMPQDEDDEGGDAPAERASTSNAKPDAVSGVCAKVGSRYKWVRSEQLFMDGKVNDVEYVRDAEVRRRVWRLAKEFSGAKRDGFPGAQPVSMDRADNHNNMAMIEQHDYMVSWKADGVRYMLLIDGEGTSYMLDRAESVFKVIGLRFAKRKSLDSPLTNCLLDGEMVVDEVTEHGVKRTVPRFLVYDAVRIGDEEGKGKDIGKCDFRKRYMAIKLEIVDPRKQAMIEGIIDQQMQPFSVRQKDFFDVTEHNVAKLLNPNFLQSHEIDGLIFQPVPGPYVVGRCDTILKWKPPHLNSVDFKLRIVKVAGGHGELPSVHACLHVQHMKEPMFKMPITKEIKQYDGKIIECSFEGDVKDGQWKFLRERTDKTLPNALQTAQNVCSSIRYPIHKEMLLKFIAERGWLSRHMRHKEMQQKRKMPPPPPPAFGDATKKTRVA